VTLAKTCHASNLMQIAKFDRSNLIAVTTIPKSDDRFAHWCI